MLNRLRPPANVLGRLRWLMLGFSTLGLIPICIKAFTGGEPVAVAITMTAALFLTFALFRSYARGQMSLFEDLVVPVATFTLTNPFEFEAVQSTLFGTVTYTNLYFNGWRGVVRTVSVQVAWLSAIVIGGNRAGFNNRAVFGVIGLTSAALFSALLSRALVKERELLANQKELEIAKRIQEGLLPRNPQLAGWNISARMIPAADIGGDYYDVLATEGGGFVGIGDVAGHGLSAGLIMLMTQSTLSGLVRQMPSASPRALLSRLNQVLFENVQERLRQSEHVTFSLLRLDPGGQVTCAGAHEDVLLLKGGALEHRETKGTWLGLTPDVEQAMTEERFTVAPGESIVLITDGILEARNPAREMFGVERLDSVLTANASKSPQQIIDAVFDAVSTFAPGERRDDMTVLVARRT